METVCTKKTAHVSPLEESQFVLWHQWKVTAVHEDDVKNEDELTKQEVLIIKDTLKMKTT